MFWLLFCKKHILNVLSSRKKQTTNLLEQRIWAACYCPCLEGLGPAPPVGSAVPVSAENRYRMRNSCQSERKRQQNQNWGWNYPCSCVKTDHSILVFIHSLGLGKRSIIIHILSFSNIISPGYAQKSIVTSLGIIGYL